VVALWVVLAVLALVVVVGSLSYAVRPRRRGGGTAAKARTRTAPRRPPSSPSRTATIAPPGPAPAAPEEPSGSGGALRSGAGAEEAVRLGTVAETPPLRERLGRTRGVFAGLRSLRGKAVDPGAWDALEEALIRADVGVATTDALLEDLRRRVRDREIGGGDELVDALRGDLVDLLSPERRRDAARGDGAGGPSPSDASGPLADSVAPVGRGLRFDDEAGVVNVWLFVGVNGVGKTTTVGKVARQQIAAGRSVLLAAGDTFRAAAAEQLDMWARRVGAEIVRGAPGGDPSAVVFDAVQRAAARGSSLVLADTAGRLHTKVNLVEELKKVRRVAERPPGRVTEVLLVLDATTGQNGLVQARQFTDAVSVTGVVLTKLDGTAKGGIVVAIQRELGVPVKLIGLGEGPDDLVPFEPAAFVAALLG